MFGSFAVALLVLLCWVFMILYGITLFVGFVFQVCAFAAALYLWRKRDVALWRCKIIAVSILSWVPDPLMGLFLWEIVALWFCIRRKLYIRLALSLFLFIAILSGILLFNVFAIAKLDKAPEGTIPITREELTNAAISPGQGGFNSACNAFRATTNNAERLVFSRTFVPVLKEYVIEAQAPDNRYNSDLTFTNIVLLLGQGTSMTTNKLVYDVSTEENPDTRVEFIANRPPVVTGVEIVSGPSE